MAFDKKLFSAHGHFGWTSSAINVGSGEGAKGEVTMSTEIQSDRDLMDALLGPAVGPRVVPCYSVEVE